MKEIQYILEIAEYGSISKAALAFSDLVIDSLNAHHKALPAQLEEVPQIGC